MAPPAQHVVVLRAASAVRLVSENDAPLSVRVQTQHGPPGFLRISNVDDPGWRLRFEVGGLASDLEDAHETLGGIAVGFAQAFSVAANAAIGLLDLTSSYRCEPGGRFARDLSSDSRPGALAPRDLDVTLAARVAAALWDASERHKRACWHFAQALQIYDPRLPTPVVGHLWIAAETLGPLSLARAKASAGVETSEQLGESWGLAVGDRVKLDNAVRNEALARDVFAGDSDLAKRLRKFADGWEHGFASFGALRRQAAKLVEEAAHLIRQALLRHTELTADDRLTLADPYFRAPVGLWGPVVRLSGVITVRSTCFRTKGRPSNPAADCSSRANRQRHQRSATSRSRLDLMPEPGTQKESRSPSTDTK